jgi:cardiolipin synthase
VIARALVAMLVVGALGCGGDPSGTDGGVIDAPDVGPDAPPCDPDRPRAVPITTVTIGPGPLEDRVVAFIDGATRSVDVQMYTFTLTRIADRLIAADRRGAPTRVLLDPGQNMTSTIRTRLVNGGVEVRDAPAGFINAHAKYVVVDGERLLLESGNFTNAGMDDQRNFAVEDSDPEDVADLVAVFAADWAGTTATLGCTRLVVTPGNARLRVQTLIANATTSLDIALYYLSDTSIRAALFTAKNRGVTIRVLLASTQEIPENGATATALTSAGISVRTLQNPVMHAKVIIADGTAALVGSNNMSQASLSNNREVGVILRETGPLSTVRTRFEGDWTAATPWQ